MQISFKATENGKKERGEVKPARTQIFYYLIMFGR